MLCDQSGISEGWTGWGKKWRWGLKVGREPLLFERHGRPKRDWGRKGGMGHVQEERTQDRTEWFMCCGHREEPKKRGSAGQIRTTRAHPPAVKHLTVYKVSGTHEVLQAVEFPQRWGGYNRGALRKVCSSNQGPSDAWFQQWKLGISAPGLQLRWKVSISKGAIVKISEELRGIPVQETGKWLEGKKKN